MTQEAPNVPVPVDSAALADMQSAVRSGDSTSLAACIVAAATKAEADVQCQRELRKASPAVKMERTGVPQNPLISLVTRAVAAVEIDAEVAAEVDSLGALFVSVLGQAQLWAEVTNEAVRRRAKEWVVSGAEYLCKKASKRGWTRNAEAPLAVSAKVAFDPATLPVTLWKKWGAVWDIQPAHSAVVALYQECFDLKKFKDAAKLVVDFELHSDTALDVSPCLPHMTVEELKAVAGSDEAAQRRLVDVLTAPASSKLAALLAKAYGFDLASLPELRSVLQGKALRYFLMKHTPLEVLDLVEGDALMEIELYRNLLASKPEEAATLHVGTPAPQRPTLPEPLASKLAQVLENVELVGRLEQEHAARLERARYFPCDVDLLPNPTLPERMLSLATLGLDLARDVEWVANVDHLAEVVATLQKEEEFVCIDSEWRPVMVAGVASKTSLFQITAGSAGKTVYLIDMNAMGSEGDRVIWGLLGAPIWKVGVAFNREDLSSLRSRSPADPDFPRECVNYADLEGLEGQLSEHTPSKAAASLATICLRVLGRGLDKSQRMVNWDRRPLTVESAVYAALDVASVREVVLQLMQRHDINAFEDIPNLGVPNPQKIPLPTATSPVSGQTEASAASEQDRWRRYRTACEPLATVGGGKKAQRKRRPRRARGGRSPNKPSPKKTVNAASSPNVATATLRWVPKA